MSNVVAHPRVEQGQAAIALRQKRQCYITRAIYNLCANLDLPEQVAFDANRKAQERFEAGWSVGRALNDAYLELTDLAMEGASCEG